MRGTCPVFCGLRLTFLTHSLSLARLSVALFVACPRFSLLLCREPTAVTVLHERSLAVLSSSTMRKAGNGHPSKSVQSSFARRGLLLIVIKRLKGAFSDGRCALSRRDKEETSALASAPQIPPRTAGDAFLGVFVCNGSRTVNMCYFFRHACTNSDKTIARQLENVPMAMDCVKISDSSMLLC